MKLIKVLSFICMLCFALALVGSSGAWGQDNITTYVFQEEFKWPKYYLIDWNRVRTCDDLLQLMSLMFKVTVTEDYENFEEVRRFLKEEAK